MEISTKALKNLEDKNIEKLVHNMFKQTNKNSNLNLYDLNIKISISIVEAYSYIIFQWAITN